MRFYFCHVGKSFKRGKREKRCPSQLYLLYPYVLVSLSPSVCGCQLFSVLIDRPPIISPFRKPLESINNNWINQQANETKNKKNQKTEKWLQRERERDTSVYTGISQVYNRLIIYLFALCFLNIKWYTTRTRWTSDGCNSHDLSLRKPHQKWKKKKIDIKKKNEKKYNSNKKRKGEMSIGSEWCSTKGGKGFIAFWCWTEIGTPIFTHRPFCVQHLSAGRFSPH